MRAVLFAIRLRLHIQNHIPLLSPLRRLFVPFSSSSHADSRVSESCSEEQGKGAYSAVYRHKLKFQRPSSIQWRREYFNSASFIGTVAQPLKGLREGFASTVLTVRDSSHSKGGFRMFLQFYDEMAKMCLEYLKENDYVYVSGRLYTDMRPKLDGNLSLLFKLRVSEVNYVTRSRDVVSQSNKELRTVEEKSAMLEKSRDRLHLWQIFFSSPFEWWDNRNCKRYPSDPDFKHKNTGESLWLKPNDPPWVMKQIQLLDLRLGERGDSEPVGRRVRFSKWDHDDS